MDRNELHLLAWHLAERGTDGVERELTALAGTARQSGVRPVAAAVLADRHAPEVARIRAFSLVAAALDAAPPHRLVAA